MLGFNSEQKMIRVIVCFFLLCTTIGCSNSIKFNHDKWLSAKDNMSWNMRKKMAQDLVGSKSLIGISKPEAIKMLGEAEEFSHSSGNELFYTIEYSYGHDIDPVKIEYLVVTFNSIEQVTGAYRKIVLDIS